jgi:diketogulonate reductase-like aldo/keto reductase
MDRDGPKAAIAALRRGLELGMTHIDTAEMYTGSEELIAEALAGRRRDDVFLVSKVLPENATRKGTVAACERSLRRLQVESLDAYLLHWPGTHPLEDTVAGFEDLVRAGKTRAWGVSNFDVDELEALLPLGRPACNQVLYHLGQRGIEHAVLPWCEAHGVAVVGYSPFGAGRFRDRQVLSGIAEAHGVTPRRVALEFLVRRPGLFTIPKSSDPTHVEQNAAPLELSESELAQIDAAFPVGRRPRRLPTL